LCGLKIAYLTHLMNLVVVSIEFLKPNYSGNGLYSRSLVRALRQAGTNVLVISGCKENFNLVTDDDEIHGTISKSSIGELRIVPIELSSSGRLDRQCAWLEFGEKLQKSSDAISEIQKFQPQAALSVDWHGFYAWKQIKDVFNSVVSCYLNFRVFSTSIELFHDDSDLKFYMEHEADAVRSSHKVIALSKKDAISLFLIGHYVNPLTGETVLVNKAKTDIQLPRIDVILPSLRQEIFELTKSPQETLQRRSLTSVVRLSPEKGPEKFVEIMEAFFLHSPTSNLRPLLGGNGPDPKYSDSLRERILATTDNAKIETSFLNPKAMSNLFSETLINFHGAAIDAYGMTIVEGAAFGAIPLLHAPHLFIDGSQSPILYAPSNISCKSEANTLQLPTAQFLPHSSGYFTLKLNQDRCDDRTVSSLLQLPLPPIGASCLFESNEHPCFLATDFDRFTPQEIANELIQVLDPANEAILASLASECRKVAVSWCEVDNAKSILQSLHSSF
jgi:glycosyltransferase involved in cell wall biosynthesis